ncbi:hypothetical protein ACFE04_014677 [Oxalis oulophora]
MRFAHFVVILSIVLLLPTLCYSDDFVCSRATYYGSPECLGTPSGACGYGEFGRSVNNAYVAGVSRNLWKNGTGCGGCYQIRCKNPYLCTEEGVKVVVTDYGEGDRTDFVMNARAYGGMAAPYKAKELYSCGVVDVEFKRIPCTYAAGYNLVVKVQEHSNYPQYIAIVMLYQAGQYDVTAVQIWQADCKEWIGMRKAYGAVWDMSSPPKGPLDLRFQVTSSAGVQYWVQATNAIPFDWKAGAGYTTMIQLN